MDYYDPNLKNPKVAGKSLLENGEINKDFGVPPSKVVAGRGISISKANGKIIISLDMSGVSNGNT